MNLIQRTIAIEKKANRVFQLAAEIQRDLVLIAQLEAITKQKFVDAVKPVWADAGRRREIPQ